MLSIEIVSIECNALVDEVAMIPGIVDTRILQHFLEMEKHIEVVSNMGEQDHLEEQNVQRPSSISRMEHKKADQLQQMQTIIEKTANNFIDVSPNHEFLNEEQSQFRQSEMAQALEVFSQNHENPIDQLEQQWQDYVKSNRKNALKAQITPTSTPLTIPPLFALLGPTIVTTLQTQTSIVPPTLPLVTPDNK